MKIISKYKDYYDFLQGIYGIDDKLILDRRKGGVKKSFYKKEALFICGKVIEFYSQDNVLYLGDKIAEISVPLTYWEKKEKILYVIRDDFTNHRYNWPKIYYSKLSEDTYNIYEKFKVYFNIYPIFLKSGHSDIIIFPQLEEIGIQKLIPAEEMWIMLTDWLSQRITETENAFNPRTDLEKIESSGFDTKISFRHRKS